MNIQDELFKLKDEKYAEFASKLAPNIPRENFIGVSVPKLRILAKKLKGTTEANSFLTHLPHKYYEENILHSLLLNEEKNINILLREIDDFLPYIDNWAVCDVLNPKVFKKYHKELIIYIEKLLKSKETYTIRFGIDMLMGHFLDDDFDPKYLKLASKIKSNEYYVNMVLAWFYATALAKKWNDTIGYIEKNILPVWVHNKTIQKAVESYRISDSNKIYLKELKRKGD